MFVKKKEAAGHAASRCALRAEVRMFVSSPGVCVVCVWRSSPVVHYCSFESSVYSEVFF